MQTVWYKENDWFFLPPVSFRTRIQVCDKAPCPSETEECIFYGKKPINFDHERDLRIVNHQIWQTKYIWKLEKKGFHYNQLLVNNSIRNLLHFHLTHLSAILRIPFVFNVKYKEHFWVSWSMVEVLNFFESQLKQPVSLRTILQTFYNSLEWPALEWLNSSMNRRGKRIGFHKRLLLNISTL